MAQFANNNFGQDTNAEHTIRCEMFISGEAVHALFLFLLSTYTAHGAPEGNSTFTSVFNGVARRRSAPRGHFNHPDIHVSRRESDEVG